LRLRKTPKKDDNYTIKGFWCKKDGFVAKSMKNFTIRRVNYSHNWENDAKR
jgi:hypothetical protein